MRQMHGSRIRYSSFTIVLVVGIFTYMFILPSISNAQVTLTPVQGQQEQVTSSKSTLKVVPAFTEVNLEKQGDSQRLEILYTNTTKDIVTLEIFPINFRHKGELGEVELYSEEAIERSYSLSSFISFDTTRIELNPNESRALQVTVNNREDVSPGGHYVAVIARMLQENLTYERDKTLISPSVSTLLLIRKTGGERFNLSLQSSSWPDGIIAFSVPISFNVRFRNEGNIHLIPYGVVEVTDWFGRLLYTGSLNTTSSAVLPSSYRQIKASLIPAQMQLPISVARVSIKGNDSLKEVYFSYEDSFVLVNMLQVGVLMVVLVGGGVMIRKFIIKRRAV